MISIITPVHNGSKYIKNCLERILQLQYKDYEVIVVDDASTDDSCRIARESGFEPICKGRIEGPALSRNTGAKKAKGEVLFFVDSDVYLNPSTLNRIDEVLNTYPDVSGIGFIYSLEHPNKNLISLYKNFSIRIEEMSKADFTPAAFRFSAFAIRKDIFDSLGGFDDAPCCEELKFTLKANEHNLKFYLDKEMNIVHAKNYNLWKLIKGDFYRAYNYFKIVFSNYRKIRKNYSEIMKAVHLPYVQLIGVGLAGVFLISSFFYITGINLMLFLITLAVIAMFQVRFLKKAHSAYGMIFAMVAFILKNLEIAIGELAMVVAFIRHFLLG